jgi:hypothetical protein
MSSGVRWFERPWPKASRTVYSVLAAAGYLCAALFAGLGAVTASTGIAGRLVWIAVAVVFALLGGMLVATLIHRGKT